MIGRFEKFTYAMTEITRCWNKIAGDEMKKYSLKAPFATYLVTLYNHPEGITASKLCELCVKDKAEISRSVALLTERGFAVKDDVTGNGYRALIKLTESGKAAAQQVCSRVNLAVEQAGNGINEAEREVFYHTFGIILKNLNNISQEGLTDESN